MVKQLVPRNPFSPDPSDVRPKSDIVPKKIILCKKNSPGQCAAYVLVAAICVAAVDFAFDGLEMIVREDLI